MWVDIVLFSSVFVWFYKHNSYVYERPDNSDPFHKRYIDNLINSDGSDTINFTYLLAIVGGLYWFKVMQLLRLSRAFGPLIKIFISMVGDISIFTCIWCV